MRNCFSFNFSKKRSGASRLEDLEFANSTGYVKSCSFCNASRDNGFDVIYEDNTYIAFRDRSPASLHHIQLIPKRHIKSVKKLGQSDLHFVESMSVLGETILDDLDVPKDHRKLGFHIPPFNSVNHLHLHLQSLPYTSRSVIKRHEYPVAKGCGNRAKGFSWFVTPEQVIQILKDNHRVGVFPV